MTDIPLDKRIVENGSDLFVVLVFTKGQWVAALVPTKLKYVVDNYLKYPDSEVAQGNVLGAAGPGGTYKLGTRDSAASMRKTALLFLKGRTKPVTGSTLKLEAKQRLTARPLDIDYAKISQFIQNVLKQEGAGYSVIRNKALRILNDVVRNVGPAVATKCENYLQNDVSAALWTRMYNDESGLPPAVTPVVEEVFVLVHDLTESM